MQVLKEISDMHRSGQHRNLYELRAEYRIKLQAAAAAPAGGGGQA
jgi:TFIIF, beta subunit HTH domain